MESIVGYIVENTVANSAPILISIAVFVSVFDKHMKTRRWVTRALLYSLVGTICGLSVYAIYDIPNRRLEVIEGSVLGAGMFLYAFSICSLVIALRAVLRSPGRARGIKTVSALFKKKPVQICVLVALGTYLMIASFNPAGSSSARRGRGGYSSWGASVEELPFVLGVLAVLIAWFIYKKWSAGLGSQTSGTPTENE